MKLKEASISVIVYRYKLQLGKYILSSWVPWFFFITVMFFLMISRSVWLGENSPYIVKKGRLNFFINVFTNVSSTRPRVRIAFAIARPITGQFVASKRRLVRHWLKNDFYSFRAITICERWLFPLINGEWCRYWSAMISFIFSEQVFTYFYAIGS